MNSTDVDDDEFDNDEALRIASLELAIQAGLQNSYDEDHSSITDAKKLIEGAKLIETYLKGTDNEDVQSSSH